MKEVELITVEVAYALPQRQQLTTLQVAPGTTAYEAVQQSGILQQFPEIDLESAKMGIFGQALGSKGLKPPKDHVLQAGDRVEIYRPLIADPKEVRKRRAEKAKQ
ncbi:MAG: RnfH family protein [Gammaproteobacteria bacterium]|nr:MAG: RnfH family protein [Gammaproteobacteria bacterium]